MGTGRTNNKKPITRPKKGTGERRRRIDAWRQVFDAAAEAGRAGLSLELPDPAAVLDPVTLARAGTVPAGDCPPSDRAAATGGPPAPDQAGTEPGRTRS